jgi:S-adenosylmethionine:tRNA-ribosyltransferase-isomerase (queuine synthetase)
MMDCKPAKIVEVKQNSLICLFSNEGKSVIGVSTTTCRSLEALSPNKLQARPLILSNNIEGSELKGILQYAF